MKKGQKNKTIKKSYGKLLCLLLALCMLFVLPMTVLAEDAVDTENTEVTTTFAETEEETTEMETESETETEPAVVVDEEQPVKNGWVLENGNWYYYQDNVTLKGWVKDNQKWYYLNADGIMLTGWQFIDGQWYYLYDSGAMAIGWIKLGNTWYYLTGSGAMATGWIFDNNKWYYLNSNGAMTTGWQFVNGKWYYMNSSGAMQTGWIKPGNSWYYLNSSGAMVTDWQKIGGVWYYFADSGIMLLENPVENRDYWYYNGGDYKVTVTKMYFGGSTCYCANIKMNADAYGRLKTGCAYSNGKESYEYGKETTKQAGDRLGAVLCVNGDYARTNSGSGKPSFSFAVKNGKIKHWREYTGAQIEANPSLIPTCTTKMAYSSRTGTLFGANTPLGDGRARNQVSLYDAVTSKYITDTFVYGEPGLVNGKVSGSNDGRRGRTMLGTDGTPGNIWIVVADGDNDDNPYTGLSNYESMALLKNLGCTFGGNIDGGGSSAMYFRGKVLVHNEGPVNGYGRAVADFVYVK